MDQRADVVNSRSADAVRLGSTEPVAFSGGSIPGRSANGARRPHRKWHFDAATWKLIRIAAGLFVSYFILAAFILFAESSATDGLIKSYPQSLWYTLVTISTVGYGDLYPVTPHGRLLAGLLILGSVGFVGYIIGKFGELAVERHHRRMLGMDGTNFTGHYVVIGWNELAQTVVHEILAAGFNVAALTDDQQDIAEMRSLFTDAKTFFVTFGVAQDDEAYRRLNIAEAIGAVLLAGDDTATLITALELKTINAKLKVTAYIKNSKLKKTVENAGVNYVISPNEIVGRMIASAMFEPDVSAFLEDALGTSTGDNDLDIQEFSLEHGALDGLTFDTARQKFAALNAQLLAISRRGSDGWKLIHHHEAVGQLRREDYAILMVNKSASDAVGSMLRVSQGRMN